MNDFVNSKEVRDVAAAGLSAKLDAQRRQSPWSLAKPVEMMRMDVSREMSLEKHGKGATPTRPENVHYVSRFGQELKSGSIQ